MRLTFPACICFFASSAIAATQWSAHYVPAGAPGSTRSSGSAQALAVDPSGNVFVAVNGESSGQPRTCLFKLSPQGNQLAQLCFTSSVTSLTLAVGPDGNPVIAGTVDPASSIQLVSPLISQTNSQAAYVTKFNSSLTQIIFSTLLGGATAGSQGSGTNASALTIDQAGNIYVAGWTADGNFPVTKGAYQTAPPAGAIPFFVTAISSSGDKLLWSTLLGGPREACSGCEPLPAVSAVAVDPAGAVVIAGTPTGEQVPITSGVIGPISNQPTAYLAKLTSAGTQLAWGTYVNSTSLSTVAFDANDNVIIGGQAYSGFTTTGGALQTNNPAEQNQYPIYNDGAGFVAKLNPTAAQFLFATYLGGNNYLRGIGSYRMEAGVNGVTGAVVDASGTIWVTGGSVPSELPLPASVPILGSNYIIGLSSDGSSVTAATTVPEGGAGLAIAISPQGPVALGKTGSTMIPVSAMPLLAGVTNAAGLTASGAVVPNELISLYGQALGPSTGLSGDIVNGAYTTSLGGVQVEFDGVPAPLLYVGTNQINAVVPSDVSGQTSTTLSITTPTGQITGIVLSVVASFPEVFAMEPPGNAAYAINQDGTLNSSSNPAAVGSIVSVWATGGGLTGNPEADGVISGTTVYPLQLPVVVGNGFPGAIGFGTPPLLTQPQVTFSADGADLVKGMFQVNFQLPTPVSSGVVPSPAGPEEFFLQVGSALSDPFTVYVQ